MSAPVLYVLSTDPARRPVAFVSQPEPCTHAAAEDAGPIRKWCACCGALGRYYGSQLRWQMPERAR